LRGSRPPGNETKGIPSMASGIQDKWLTPEQAIRKIHSGNRLFIGSGSAVPLRLVETLSQSMGQSIDDAEVVHLFVNRGLPYVDACLLGKFRLKTFHVDPGIDASVTESCADHIPMFHSQIPALLRSGRLRIDAALIQVAPPDKHGYLNLGVGVDVTRAALAAARLVIAEVNPAMPRTLGSTQVRLEEVDHLVEGYDTLLEVQAPKPDAVEERIGYHVAQLIEDGSCLHTGFEQIPRAILTHLADKNDLGLHTEMFSDGVIPLMETGVLTNSRKHINTGKCVASFCMGTGRLFRLVDDNPAFEFLPTDYTNDPYNISRNERVCAIIGADSIDLTGQVAYSVEAGGSLGGFGGDFDFITGASLSKGGKPIVVLRSSRKGGQVSAIVSALDRARGVAASRANVHYVVTEYGIANLHGKCIRERAMSLIGIAHPDHREALISEAKEMGYIYKDQVFIRESGHLYPYDLETSKEFKGGLQVFFRPIKPDDEAMMKELFYDFSPESIYLRYFSRLKSMPHRRLQQDVNIDYQSTMSLVGVLGRFQNDRIIAEGRYAVDPSTGFAEVAFTVDEDYQNLGISTFLLDYLGKIANERGVKGFTAYVMQDNIPMIKVMKKLYPDMKMKLEEAGVYHVSMPFDEPSAPSRPKAGQKGDDVGTL